MTHMKRTNAETAFIRTVRRYYKNHGRHDLPWRRTTDPYKILVSEVMLQQTQVPRVVPKYALFLKSFPNVGALARAPLGDVLRAWQGLGYNRRAKLLHECANAACGGFPKTYRDLVLLPGVGPYTAGAVMAFAYNEPVVLIETNIRTVYLHHFFPDRTDVRDTELLPYIERTLDQKNPRAWYAALMDYGAHLKASIGNQNHRSRAYAKQSAFKGSDREIRGATLRLLSEKHATARAVAVQLSTFPKERVYAQLSALHAEGLIAKRGRVYTLPR